MEIKELAIKGCFLITPNVFKDQRGTFVKTFHAETLHEFGIELELKEEFYSISNKNVLRGLHFQKPPAAHKKVVYCPQGAVIDFFVDIRAGSPTYGKIISVELNEDNCQVLFLPTGIAHGFVSLKNNTLMVYKTDCSYDPEADDGIHFDSCNIPLPVKSDELIVSPRDSGFISLGNFESKFIYE